MSLKQIYDSPRYRKMLALLEKKPCLGLSEMPIINRKTLPFATERVAVRVCLCVFVCSRGDFNLSVVMSPLWSSLCSVAICSVAWSSTRQSFLCLPLYFCHLLFLSFYLFTVSSRYLSSVFLFFFFLSTGALFWSVLPSVWFSLISSFFSVCHCWSQDEE